MNRSSERRWLNLLAGAASIAAVLMLSCDAGPPAATQPRRQAEPVTEPRPPKAAEPAMVEPAPAPAPTEASAAAPPQAAPAPLAAPSAPSPREPAAAPKALTKPIPEYIELLERFRFDRSGQIDASTVGEDRIVITSDNVKRIRLYRDKLPLKKTGSIYLQIDQSRIEWTSRSREVKLERSQNGDWRAAEED